MDIVRVTALINSGCPEVTLDSRWKSDNEFNAFITALKDSDTLRSLAISVFFTEAEFKTFHQALAYSTQLTSLSFKGCQLNEKRFELLAPVIGELRQLRLLSVSNDLGLGNSAIDLLCQHLPKATRIAVLELRYIGFDHAGFQRLISLLEKLPSLRRLDLTGNEIRENIGDDIESLMARTRLSHLALPHFSPHHEVEVTSSWMAGNEELVEIQPFWILNANQNFLNLVQKNQDETKKKIAAALTQITQALLTDTLLPEGRGKAAASFDVMFVGKQLIMLGELFLAYRPHTNQDRNRSLPRGWVKFFDTWMLLVVCFHLAVLDTKSSSNLRSPPRPLLAAVATQSQMDQISSCYEQSRAELTSYLLERSVDPSLNDEERRVFSHSAICFYVTNDNHAARLAPAAKQLVFGNQYSERMTVSVSFDEIVQRAQRKALETRFVLSPLPSCEPSLTSILSDIHQTSEQALRHAQRYTLLRLLDQIESQAPSSPTAMRNSQQPNVMFAPAQFSQAQIRTAADALKRFFKKAGSPIPTPAEQEALASVPEIRELVWYGGVNALVRHEVRTVPAFFKRLHGIRYEIEQDCSLGSDDDSEDCESADTSNRSELTLSSSSSR